MTRHAGSTDQAPAPAGPYSQAIRTGDLVFAAGQGGHDLQGDLALDIAEQTRQCLQNLLAVLRSAGAEEQDVVRVGVFLTDPAHFDAMNEVYRTVFTSPWPARTTVYVGLPAGMLVEIDAVAAIS